MRKTIAAFIIAAGLVSSPYIGLAAKVVVDPGHGGTDPGAVGINGLYEKTVNDEISKRLKQLLEQHGYEVLMTRQTDRNLSLQERVEIAKAAEADLFVSVHANAHPSSSVRGTMVLYHDASKPNPDYPASPEMRALSPQSRQLAQLIQSSMLEQVPNVDRGLLKSSAYVVRMGNIPSVLVETAFLSNAQDAKLLASPTIRDKYAVGILNGIMKYLPPIFSDIGKHWARESIVRMNERGIANGNDGKFNPDQPLTRAELVSFAERAFGFPGARSGVVTAEASSEPSSVSEDVYGGASEDAETPPAEPMPAPQPTFADLPAAHWSHDTMQAAILSGVLRGYPDGTVRPDAPVTRAEVAVVLDRLIGTSLSPEFDAPSYMDVNAQNWAFDSIQRLSVSGIVRGVAESQYGPERKVTRAEMATMVDRQLSRTPVVVDAIVATGNPDEPIQ
ncbi:N-acetylmuramoyl-L-alanine amidase [Paenibacillus sp. TRM 82003]|nr:N-acetylmuramoyl-L-alanine amidase [Paenibacillus sp. TRM 82003]